MSVPVLGAYLSEDGAYKIQINSANSSNSQIDAVYEAQNSPEGGIQQKGNIGQYYWVFSKKAGRDGVAPFSIRFQAMQRPNGRPYTIEDSWVGYYLENNTMVLDGVRSYVNSDGVTDTSSLGTHTFKM